MQIAYFDEVKYQRARMPNYWLGAVVADAATIWALEGAVNRLALEVFGVLNVSKDTEFHAADLLNGHEHFEGWQMERRIDVLKRLITIFGSAPGLGKIFVKMHPERMVSADVEGKAFMFLVERVEGLLRERNTPGLLIGDKESDTVAHAFAQDLSAYRATGTPFAFGMKLEFLLDTVHFTHSHHSRMLQLADLHVWMRQLCSIGHQDKWHRKQIIDHIQSIPDCLHAHRYKDWPTTGSWVTVG